MIPSKLEIVLERKIYAKSLYEFYKAAFCQLHPGEAYDENWHAKYLCDVLQEETFRVINGIPREKDIIINISPRSSKSMIASVIWPAWAWTIKTSLKFISGSYSDTLAVNHARLTKDLILSKWYQRLYGHKVRLRSDLQGAGHYGNTDTGFRYAFGLDGTVTGFGGDFVLADDLQNPKKANSEVERKNTITRWDETISNRLNQLEVGGRIIIMQRLHEDDLTGYLLNPRTGRPDSHRHICIPAELDLEMISPKELQVHYKDGLFWPSRFSKKVIADEKKKGVLYFAGQFGQRPVPPEGNIFKRKWFDIVSPIMVQRDVQNSPIHFIIDSAYTEDETVRNDPSGILCVFKKDNYIFVINFVQVWLEFPELIKFIKQYVLVNGWTYNSLILIEPKASGKSIAQQLKAGLEEGENPFNVVEIEGEWIRDDKVTRANSVSPIAMARRFKLVEGPWNDLYLGQLTSFPKASHDEAVDLTVYAANYLIPMNEFLSAWI